MAEPARAAPLLLAPAGILLAAAVFAGDGSSDERLVWIGGGALLVSGAALAAVLLGLWPRPEVGRTGALLVALLSAFVLWSGLSIAWSIQGDRSWSFFNRGLAYLGFVGLGLFVGALVPRASRRVAAGLALLLAAVLVWGLAGKVIPALGPDLSRNARLRAPVGYWNALAVLGVMALLLGLWAAVPRTRAAWARAAGALLVYLAVAAVLLTVSRGGIAIAVVAVAAWLALTGARLETIVVLALSAPPALALAAWAFTRPALVDEGERHAERVRDGWIFGVLLLLGAVLVGAGAFLLSRAQARRVMGPARARAVVRGALAGAGLLVLVALAVGFVRAGGPVDWTRDRIQEFSNPTPIEERPSRLQTGSSNYRWAWWRKSLDSFADEPVGGTGAGSFELAHRLYRTEYTPPARDPHNLFLQSLGETGLVGLSLLLGAVAAAFFAVRAKLGRLEGPDRLAAKTLALCALAYLVHLLVDSGFEFVAVSAPVSFILGFFAGRGLAAPVRVRRPLWAAAAAGLALVALSSLAATWLAERKTRSSLHALLAGDAAQAVERAQEANRLNPLAVDPLWWWAAAEGRRGDDAEALRLYRKATEIEPLNADTWFALGSYEVEALDDCRSGYEHLNRSYTLDRFGPAGKPGTPLDRARAAVNAGRSRC